MGELRRKCFGIMPIRGRVRKQGSMPPIAFKADRRDGGQTLAAVLKAHFQISWSKAKQTIERRHVRVSGQIIADAAYRVKAGKRITIAAGAIENPKPRLAATTAAAVAAPKKAKEKGKSQKKENVKAEPGVIAATIVYCDEHVVVVDKPAGLTTMRHKEEAAEFGRGQRFLPKTLMDFLPQLVGEPKAKFLAVHRIDRDTSGLVIFARTATAARHLMKQFREHTIQRKYLALIRGQVKNGWIVSPLVPDRGDGRRGTGPGGKNAATAVRMMESLGPFSLVECRLATGRTHQVRIHLGEERAPLCGDRVYDRPLHGSPLPDMSGAARPMLHASRLGFTHPVSREELCFDAEPPADFAALLQSFRKSRVP